MQTQFSMDKSNNQKVIDVTNYFKTEGDIDCPITGYSMVYSLLNIQFPANVVNFTSKLKSVVSFDVLKLFVTPLNKFLFTFDYKGEKTEKDKKMISPLKELNYQNTNCVLNLGLFGQLIAYYFFMVIVQYPVVYLLSEISDRFKPR